MARVLVVDDSPSFLEGAVKALEQAGVEAHSASDKRGLTSALEKGPFELLVVGDASPAAFGADIATFLQQERKVGVRLLLCSDAPPEGLAAQAQAAKADSAVSKSTGTEGLVAAAKEQLAGAKKAGEPAGPRKPRVLIVDDSETTAMLIEAELTAKGFEVFYADTADKATKIILKKKTRPDLVLLDVRMPNVNGEQFCRFIKSNSLFAGIKVLLCSGEEPEELKRICREAGADGFVAKDAVLSKVLAGALS